MAKEKKTNECKPKRSKKTGTIMAGKIGDFSFHSQNVEMRAKLEKNRTRAPDYIDSEVAPGPMAITVTEKCKARYPKDHARHGQPIDYRDCDISLQFIGASTAPKTGLATGAYLRVCKKWGDEPVMVPVATQREAQEKSAAICGCVSTGEKSDKCAKKISPLRARFTRPKAKAKSKAHSQAKEGNDCLQWSKNGKRCLRREKV